MADSIEMRQEQLRAIRARLGEPPPLLAVAERNQGQTALIEYLRRLQDERMALVDEVDRLRAEAADQDKGEADHRCCTQPAFSARDTWLPQ